MCLAGKVTLVTSASRGIGKGIATVFGEKGATVYVTGRTMRAAQGPFPGTISETADIITAAGGIGLASTCDHSDDEQVGAHYKTSNTIALQLSRSGLVPQRLNGLSKHCRKCWQITAWHRNLNLSSLPTWR